jgi:hypothetical protein
MEEIVPIKTFYDGIWFKSRLEARWAVLFDILEIPYVYEIRHFDLGGIIYIPDFWLPTLNCWIEVKGEKPTPEEGLKADLLARRTGKNVYIFIGSIPAAKFRDRAGWLEWGEKSSEVYHHELGLYDFNHWLCQCPYCGFFGITHAGSYAGMDCCIRNRANKYEDDDFLTDFSKQGTLHIFNTAFNTARYYKFV